MSICRPLFQQIGAIAVSDLLSKVIFFIDLDHNVLAFGNEEGNLHIMKSIESDITGNSIEDDNESLNIVNRWSAHKNAIFDVAWRPDDRWIVIIWNFSILIFYSAPPQPILLAKCGMLNEK